MNRGFFVNYEEAVNLVNTYPELQFSYDGRLTSSFNDYSVLYTDVEEFDKDYAHYIECKLVEGCIHNEIYNSITKRTGKPYEVLKGIQQTYTKELDLLYKIHNLLTPLEYADYELIFNHRDVKEMLDLLNEAYPTLKLDEYGVYRTEAGHVCRINFLDFDKFVITVGYCLDLFKMELTDTLDGRYKSFNKEMKALYPYYLPVTETKFKSYLKYLV